MNHRFAIAAALALGVASCTNIECPLDNQVLMTVGFYDKATHQPVKLSDTLTIYGLKNGAENIAFNRGIDINTLLVPLNSASQRDTFLLRFVGSSLAQVDTLYIQHTPRPHFEAIDCPASTFHQLIALSHSRRGATTFTQTIDSVAISTPSVQYEDIEHIKIFLRAATQ
ncbi:MAG: hypothetical protein HUK09_07665 [Bacteroidaceae bacterium]|nr:hypothetical protein [Bacteroidaceae bacterium]